MADEIKCYMHILILILRVNQLTSLFSKCWWARLPLEGSPLIFFHSSTLSAFDNWCTMLLLFVHVLYSFISGSSGTLFSHLSSSLFKNASVFRSVISLPLVWHWTVSSTFDQSYYLLSWCFCFFLIHFNCEFFIVLCLALSFISNPINFFPGLQCVAMH